MKKLLLMFILLLISASIAPAAGSRSYYFTTAMLQSIAKFDDANEIVRKATDTEDKAAAIRKFNQSIAIMKEAKNIIRPWLSEPNEKITRPAKAIDQGFDVFIADAEKVASFYERASRGETVSEDEGLDYAVEGEKNEDAAYLNMGSAIANYVPEGLTNKERKQLLLRIFFLFDKDLKKYRFEPAAVTEVTIGISALESRIEGKDIEKNPYFKMLMNGEAPFPEK